MENRRELVGKIIDMMKQGYFFNTPEWELFRACADAEKIAEYLVGNYEKKYQISRIAQEEIPDRKEIHKKEKNIIVR